MLSPHPPHDGFLSLVKRSPHICPSTTSEPCTIKGTLPRTSALFPLDQTSDSVQSSFQASEILPSKSTSVSSTFLRPLLLALLGQPRQVCLLVTRPLSVLVPLPLSLHPATAGDDGRADRRLG